MSVPFYELDCVIYDMLRCMFKWTRDFEAARPEFTEMLSEYSGKLIVATSSEDAEHSLKKY